MRDVQYRGVRDGAATDDVCEMRRYSTATDR